MKKIVYLILLTLSFCCCGSFSQKGVQINHEDDSLNIRDYGDSLSAEDYKKRGNINVDSGDFQGAIQCYTKALNINPNYWVAYFNRGVVKSRIGDTEGAIKDYTKSIELMPNDADTYYARGNAKSEFGDQKGALVDYTRAIEIDSTYIKAYVNRGATKYEVGDYEGEIADYKLGIKKCAPYDAVIYNNLGRALYDLKRFHESAAAYGEGIAHFPEDCKLYYGRGLARQQSGDEKGACQDWRKSSALGCFQANALLPLCKDCDTINNTR